MDYFIRETHEKYYNCSFYEIADIPLERRQHKLIAAFFLVQFFVYETLYIPCLFSIWKHTEQSCYKFMFAIGIIDSYALIFAALLPGIFGFTGTGSYCSSPNFMFFAGNCAFGCWVLETTVDISLAINRCIETLSPSLGERLYRGWRAWLWLLPLIFYTIYVLIYEKTVFFSSVYYSYISNPHAGYHDEMADEYANYFLLYHNITILFGTIFAYATYLIAFFFKFARLTTDAASTQKRIFMQVVAISSFNCLCALFYLYVGFVEVTQILSYMASFFWLSVHGSTSLVYLCMNKTIRKDCIKFLKPILMKLKIIEDLPKTHTHSRIAPSSANETHAMKVQSKTLTVSAISTRQ